jgi:hypothetical protein
MECFGPQVLAPALDFVSGQVVRPFAPDFWRVAAEVETGVSVAGVSAAWAAAVEVVAGASAAWVVAVEVAAGASAAWVAAVEVAAGGRERGCWPYSWSCSDSVLGEAVVA